MVTNGEKGMWQRKLGFHEDVELMFTLVINTP